MFANETEWIKYSKLKCNIKYKMFVTGFKVIQLPWCDGLKKSLPFMLRHQKQYKIHTLVMSFSLHDDEKENVMYTKSFYTWVYI